MFKCYMTYFVCKNKRLLIICDGFNKVGIIINIFAICSCCSYCWFSNKIRISYYTSKKRIFYKLKMENGLLVLAVLFLRIEMNQRKISAIPKVILPKPAIVIVMYYSPMMLSNLSKNTLKAKS